MISRKVEYEKAIKAIKECFDEGIIKITHGKEAYGCTGVVCEFNYKYSHGQFYFDNEASTFEGDVSEYLRICGGMKNICGKIAEVFFEPEINGMGELEAELYISYIHELTGYKFHHVSEFKKANWIRKKVRKLDKEGYNVRGYEDLDPFYMDARWYMGGKGNEKLEIPLHLRNKEMEISLEIRGEESAKYICDDEIQAEYMSGASSCSFKDIFGFIFKNDDELNSAIEKGLFIEDSRCHLAVVISKEGKSYRYEKEIQRIDDLLELGTIQKIEKSLQKKA